MILVLKILLFFFERKGTFLFIIFLKKVFFNKKFFKGGYGKNKKKSSVYNKFRKITALYS